MAKLLLARALEKKGLSKRKFSAMLGISYPHVFRFFRPNYDPKLSTLEKWARVLNMKIRDLIQEG